MIETSISVEKLTRARFADFGDVIEAPDAAGRLHLDNPGLRTAPEAKFSFWCSRIEKSATLPLIARQMERHQFSAQMFIPLRPTRWLVLVAPMNAQGLPDMAAARAFMPEAGQGICYAPNTWHHPLAVLGAPAEFAVSQWKLSDERDEEFVDVSPTEVKIQ